MRVNGRLGIGLICAGLAACGDGSGEAGGGSTSPPPPPSPPPAMYSIGGAVSGLTGSGLVLRNGAESLSVPAAGNFVFVNRVVAGASYAVTVAAQPVGATCSISNGSGTATTNVTTVSVTCVANSQPPPPPPANTYTIGGTTSGLAGSGLILHNNGADDLAVGNNGTFTFATTLAAGAAYAVTVATQPAGQTCAVSAGSDTVGTANITSIGVSCTNNSTPPPTGSFTISGTVTGLGAAGLVLQNNGGDGITVPSGASTFTFPTSLASGTAYNVTVATQPSLHQCTVSNATGTVTASVTNVAIACVVSTAPGLAMGLIPVKLLHFGWNEVPGADSFRLLEDANGTQNFIQYGVDLPATTMALDVITPLALRSNASYRLQACKAGFCIDSNTHHLTGGDLTPLIGYFKASNPGEQDNFGVNVALSGDGDTLAVGACGEGSSTTGINGNQNDDSAANAGAVYIFIRDGAHWSQQAYVKASNTNGGDYFGCAVALSDDGNTLAVGAKGEASSATGINGLEGINAASQAGAVYVFARSRATWTQEAYIKASNTGATDFFGESVALSANGSTLAVGAPEEDSGATGSNGAQDDNSVLGSGAVYVFTRAGRPAIWSQQAYIKASNTGTDDHFGFDLALSDNGSTLAVGAPGERSTATGIDGNQADDAAAWAGAAYVFLRTGSNWSQQAYVKASNTGANDYFGGYLSLSGDGNTLAVGAPYEDSIASGIDGDQSDNTVAGSGAAYVFQRTATIWTQQAYIKASNPGNSDSFGSSMALSADGNVLAVGAAGENSIYTGVNPPQYSGALPDAGAAYVFARSGSTWSQSAYVKSPNPGGEDFFGAALTLSDDGNTLAVGAFSEDSASHGVGGAQDDDQFGAGFDAGAVYVY